MHYRLIFYS